MASPTGEAVLSLVRKAQKEADLFVILGDLFDIWLGDSKASQNEFLELIQEFQKLVKTCRVLYFEGNHDIHLTEFWQNQMKFEVHAGPFSFEYNGIKIWAEHGDEINKNDRGYLFLRWFLRTKPLKFLIKTIPSKIVTEIGNQASASSRSYTNKKKDRPIEIIRNYAIEISKLEKFDLMVTGHTHNADDYSFELNGKKHRAINLGSWFDGPHYLCISGSDLSILPV